MNRLLLISILLLPIAACTTAQTATVTTDVTNALTTAKAKLSDASTYIGIAIGAAQIAELAKPALVPVLSPAVADLQALETTAQTTLASATSDVPTVNALVATINTQAQAVITTAAPVIKLVPQTAAAIKAAPVPVAPVVTAPAT